MKIALVTDTHLSPSDTLLVENWRAADRWAGEVGADLLAHLGDITADGARRPGELAHARGLITASQRDRLFLPGNHDIGDGPGEGGARGLEGEVRPESLDEYRRQFGPDFWSLQVAGWRLLGVNAQLFGCGGEEEARQWAWLEEVVASGEGPLGLFCHKPVVPHGGPSRDAPSRYPTPPTRARLLSLLRANDLRFVVSGHTHQALRFRDEGVEHLWVPSTAFVIPDALQAPVGEKRLGAGVLELAPGGYRFSFADPPGLTPYDLRELAHIYPEVAGLEHGADGCP